MVAVTPDDLAGEFARAAPELDRLGRQLLEPERGHLQPDRGRPGLGLEIKRVDAAHYLV